MNYWEIFIHNIKAICNFRDPITGELFFGDYLKMLNFEYLPGRKVDPVETGMCLGLTYMWIQAVLCGEKETDKFRNRLQILATHPDTGWQTPPPFNKHFNNIGELIYYVRQKVRQHIIVTPELEKYLEIPAFLDGIFLYQCPEENYSTTRQSSTDPGKISPYTICEFLAGNLEVQHQPLLEIYNQSWVLPDNTMVHILRPLLNHISNQAQDIPFAISVSAIHTYDNIGHTIGIKLTKEGFTIFDQNYMCENRFHENAACCIPVKLANILSRQIYQRFPALNYLRTVFNIRVYMSSKHSQIFFRPAKERLLTDLNAYITHSHTAGIRERHRDRASHSLHLINRMEHYFEIQTFINEELSLFIPENLLNPRFMHFNRDANPQDYRIDKYYIILMDFFSHIHNCLLTNDNYNRMYQYMLPSSTNPGTAITSLLHFAVQHRNFNLVYDLLNNGANANMPDNKLTVPLHYAAEKGYIHIAMALIERNADIEQKNSESYSPLHIACLNGHTDLAILLLNRGANISTVDKDGFTPLHTSITQEEIKMTFILLRNHAAINAKERSGGYTPLHLAVIKRDMELTRILILAGADTNITDDSNLTPLQLANNMGHNDIAELFAGCNPIQMSRTLRALEINPGAHPAQQNYTIPRRRQSIP